MPRLRFLFAAFSAVLCLLTLGLSSRSYRTRDLLTYNHLWGDQNNSHRRYLGVFSDSGRFHLFFHVEHRMGPEWSLLTDPCAGQPGFWYVSAPHDPNAPHLRLYSSSYQRSGDLVSADLLLPHWVFAFLLSLPFLLRPLRLMRGRPRSDGHCPTCNYDLRATPNLCPECGHRVVPG